MEDHDGFKKLLKSSNELKSNCDNIISTFVQIKKEVDNLIENVRRARNISESRNEFYNASNKVGIFSSYVNEILYSIELDNIFANVDQKSKLIDIPYLPPFDSECQQQVFMKFLRGDSPWNFWLSHCEENTTRRLEEMLQKRTSSSDLQRCETVPIVGDFVLYKEGKKIQRAIVQETLSKKRLKVVDVDSGATTLTRIDRLYMIDEEVASIHSQALNCTLIENLDDSTLWTKELENIFESTLKRCRLSVEIVEKRQGCPISVLIKMQAEDVDDTEETVDVGEWISARVIPEARRGPVLRPSVLDAFYSQLSSDDSEFHLSDDDNNNDDDDDDNNNDDDGKHSQTPSGASQNESCDQHRTLNKIVSKSETYLVDDNGRHSQTPSGASQNESCDQHKTVNIVSKSERNSVDHYRFVNVANINHPIRAKNILTGHNMSKSHIVQNPANAALQTIFVTKQWSPHDLSVQATEKKGVHVKLELKNSVTLTNPNEEVHATIVYVVSPEEFYVHLVNKNNSKIEMLECDLEEFYSVPNGNHEEFDVSSKYCAVKFVGKALFNCEPLTNWFRGEIVDARKDEALVLLVDYGLTTCIKWSDMKTLNSRFYVYNKMAQQCHLAGIESFGNKEFAQHVTDYFKRFLLTKQQYRLIVEEDKTLRSKSSLAVVVKKPDNAAGSLNDELNEFIRTTNTSPPNTDCDDESAKNWNPMAEDFYNERNRYDLDVDDACVAVAGYTPTDDERICKFYRKDGRCWKTSCTKEHVIVDPDVYSTDKLEFYLDAFSKPKLPHEGSRLKMKITAAASATRFYAQWISKTAETSRKQRRKTERCANEEGEEEDDEEEQETLQTLMNYLNSPQNVIKFKHFVCLPSKGELVIAKSVVESKETVWFRARVDEIVDSYCSVFFVDFGTTSTIPIKFLRIMEPQYLHLPFQAIECSIAGIAMIESKWRVNEPFTSFLSDLVGSNCSAYVLKCHESDQLDVLLENEQGQDIGTLLVKSGYYCFVDIPDGEEGPIQPG